jgi:hypothetical protein
MLALLSLPHLVTDIEDLPTSDQLMFEPEPIQQYVITDMKYHAPDKSLYCSGISSLTTASTMRIYEWPFLGSYKTKGLSSFNVSHQQWESHAPIRHFDILEVDLEQWGPWPTYLSRNFTPVEKRTKSKREPLPKLGVAVHR